jgi:hypothetical protein
LPTASRRSIGAGFGAVREDRPEVAINNFLDAVGDGRLTVDDTVGFGGNLACCSRSTRRPASA